MKSALSSAFYNSLPPTGQTDAALEIRGLSLRYGARPVFKNLDLDIVSGRITAMVGPSGCGKTSFLTCLNRLVEMTPSAALEGCIRAGGREILEAGVDLIALRRRVGMIFQRPNPFPLSIEKNLDYPLREHGLRDRKERTSRLRRGLVDVGLWEEVKDRLDSPALALSGGQQQRLCIARALVLEPEILLMDEPCSALDPLASGVVEDLIVRLRESYTILIVTHNLAQARRIADFVAVFWLDEGCGKLVEYGSRKQIFEAPVHPITASYVNGLRG